MEPTGPWAPRRQPNPRVTAPIVGATRIEHLEDALAAEQLSLSPEDVQRLEEPYVPHRIAGHQ